MYLQTRTVYHPRSGGKVNVVEPLSRMSVVNQRAPVVTGKPVPQPRFGTPPQRPSVWNKFGQLTRS